MTAPATNSRPIRLERVYSDDMSDMIHRYKVGQVVAIRTSVMRLAADGVYTITRLLPSDSSDPRYCLKSERENFERIVPEGDLSSAV